MIRRNALFQKMNGLKQKLAIHYILVLGYVCRYVEKLKIIKDRNKNTN